MRLFVVVCRAVAAAHKNLIVHRDIKPSNIMVDVESKVKLLDFGSAKLLADDQDEATWAGAAALTRAMPRRSNSTEASYRQPLMSTHLGVLLHELLLDAKPAWRDTDPRKPSTRVIELDATARTPLMSRAGLRQALRGDLDNIVTKALANEPDQRYASAGDFADDIERHPMPSLSLRIRRQTGIGPESLFAGIAAAWC
ncbi:MAG: protein kinase [Xanthomonadales bacterium]|nr:protein kinase [Xanthomonadales bacterium]